MSLNIFYITCLVGALACSVMFYFLWSVIEKTCIFFTGAEKAGEAERKSGFAEGEKENSKQAQQSLQKKTALKNLIGINKILYIKSDLKYLSHYTLKHLKYYEDGEKPFNSSGYFKNIYGSQNVQTLIQVTKKPTLLEETNRSSFNALVKAKGTTMLTITKNKTVTLHLNERLFSVKVIEDQSVTNVNEKYFCGIQLQRGRPCRSLVLCKKSKVNKENQLRLLQLIAKCLTEYFKVNPSNCLDNIECRNSTFKIQQEETITSTSITELNSSEEAEMSKKQVKVEDCEEFLKCSKLTKKKKSVREKSQKQHGNAAKYVGRNMSYSNSKLVAEIERQLKPITDQIDELRQSIVDFSVLNWEYKNKRAKSKILSVKPINLNNKSKSTMVFPSYSSTPTNISGSKVCLVVSCCPGECPHKTDQKGMSPLAEMYIILSKL